VDQVEQFACRPPEPVQLGDEHNVALAERRHDFCELRPVGADAADLLAEDCRGTGVLEGFELEAQVLVLSAYSRISNEKARGWLRPPGSGGFSVKNSHTSPKQIAYQQKLAQALDLRRQGYDFDAIAAQMKMSRTTVHRWVVAAMDRMIEEPARAVLKMEIARPQ
jgi:hypothetical protein